eukprot:1576081-Rhodomonas_salina.1
MSLCQNPSASTILPDSETQKHNLVLQIWLPLQQFGLELTICIKQKTAGRGGLGGLGGCERKWAFRVLGPLGASACVT